MKFQAVKLLLSTAALLPLLAGVAKPHPIEGGYEGKEEPPSVQIYVATSGGVKAFSFATSQATLVLNQTASGIAYDPKTDKLYAITDRSHAILRANPDGSEADRVFNYTNHPTDFVGLAVDTTTRNLYVLDYGSEVLVCNTSAAMFSCKRIIDELSGMSYGHPAVNPSAGTLYFASTTPPIIWRSALDGSNITILYEKDDFYTDIQGIAVDPENSKLYWAEGYLKRIMVADLDAKNPQPLVTGVNPWGLAYADGRIYWTDSFKSLKSCNSTSGQDVQAHFTGTDYMYQLTVVG